MFCAIDVPPVANWATAVCTGFLVLSKLIDYRQQRNGKGWVDKEHFTRFENKWEKQFSDYMLQRENDFNAFKRDIYIRLDSFTKERQKETDFINGPSPKLK